MALAAHLRCRQPGRAVPAPAALGQRSSPARPDCLQGAHGSSCREWGPHPGPRAPAPRRWPAAAGHAPLRAATAAMSASTSRTFCSRIGVLEARLTAAVVIRRQVLAASGSCRPGSRGPADCRRPDPTPSSRQVASMPCSGSRDQREYSLCTAAIGCTACARRRVCDAALGQPDVADLAGLHQLRQCAHGFLDRSSCDRCDAGRTGRCGRVPRRVRLASTGSANGLRADCRRPAGRRHCG